MAPLQLTPAQQAALSHDRHIVVTAGAGTGKTEVLIRRFLRLLAQPDVRHINQVLAITYTEKAAGEMKSRVYRALLERAQDPGTPPRDREKFRRMLEQFPSNHISTIHAFFASVLRRFPYAIPGLDPDFGILEGYRQRLLLRESVERVLDEAATQRDHSGRAALEHLLVARRKRDLLAMIQELVARRQDLRPWLQRLRETEDEELLATWRRMTQETVAATFLEATHELQGWRDVLRACEPVKPQDDDPAVQTRRCILHAFDAGDPTELLEVLYTAAGEPRSFRQGNRAVWGDEGKRRVNECFAAIAAGLLPYRERLKVTWDEEVERQALGDLRALAPLTEAAMEAYQKAKWQRGVLDFADLEICAAQALDNPPLRSIYQRQFRYLMVDEFQDTNRSQWFQIRRLAEDPETGELCPDKLFVVGDEKQAIYRFRGGEVEVCDDAQRRLPRANREAGRVGPYPVEQASRRLANLPTDGRLGFDVNFRSRPNLLYFFNTFFAPPFFAPPDKRKPYEAAAQPLRGRAGTLPAEPQADPTMGTVACFRLGPDGGEEESVSADVREAQLIAQRLRQVQDGALDAEYPGLREALERKERAVGLLFRRRTKQKVYEQALREYGVPYVVARGRGFFARQEVLDVANALRVLADPRQDVALVGLLRSPFFAVSDSALVHLSRIPGEGYREKLLHLTSFIVRRRSPDRAAPLHLSSLSAADRQALLKAQTLLTDWETQRPYLRTSELIHYLLETSGVMAALNRGSDGPQRVSNVYKLIDLARQFEAEGPHTLVDFVDFLQTQVEGEEEEAEADLPEGGGVQIMTVHQSKGLEFPLVILPDLSYHFRRDSGLLLGRLPVTPPLTKGGPEGFSPPCEGGGQGGVVPGAEGERDGTFEVGWQLAVDASEGAPTAIRQLLAAESWQQTVAEEKRLLYVACTRARDHLWLCVREPQENKTPRLLETARSWNDWVWLRLQDPEFSWVRALPPAETPRTPAAEGTEPVQFDPAALAPFWPCSSPRL